jgi:hypothetical protein
MNRPVLPVNRTGFFLSGNRSVHCIINPGTTPVVWRRGDQHNFVQRPRPCRLPPQFRVKKNCTLTSDELRVFLHVGGWPVLETFFYNNSRVFVSPSSSRVFVSSPTLFHPHLLLVCDPCGKNTMHCRCTLAHTIFFYIFMLRVIH